MPPQQTNFTSETGRDAARLHLAAALVKDATGNALAEARPDASIAALRDTLSEKEAAGPPVASTRGLLSLVQEYWGALRKRCLKGAPASLHDLSDRHLKDIGLPPSDIDCIVARRASERFKDGAMYL
jgi:uncharacterized protein YjiS (DUF1127 family)